MNDCIKITFLGDIMCEGRMIDAYKYPNGFSFGEAFASMKPYLSSSDFVCANLETPISFNNTDLTHGLWSFNSPYEFAQAVYASGVNFVSTANNHCLDRGLRGVSSTIKTLNEIGLKHTGVFDSLKDKKPLVVNVCGVNIGLMAYTYGTNAFSNNYYLLRKDRWRVNLFQKQELSNRISRYCFEKPHSRLTKFYNFLRRHFYPINVNKQVYERRECHYRERKQIIKEISELKKNGADIIVMYMHAGGQYNTSETTSTIELTEFLTNHGVNIVVGSHEHVVHGSSISKDKLISYSLGNYLGNYGTFAEPFDKMAEYSVAWNIYINKNEKNIVKVSFSVLKTIGIGGKENAVKTVPVYDLIEQIPDVNEKQDLIDDMLRIVKKFSNIETMDIKAEYYQKI